MIPSRPQENKSSLVRPPGGFSSPTEEKTKLKKAVTSINKKSLHSKRDQKQQPIVNALSSNSDPMFNNTLQVTYYQITRIFSIFDSKL